MFESPESAIVCSWELSGVVVRETVCKTIINADSSGNYSLNCYRGCTHGCAYCYARFMQRFHPRGEPWGGFVDVKINAVEALKRQLRRLKPGEVFVSSACDGWQPIEAQYRLTRRCCELLLEFGFHVNLLTKSVLALRDMDVFAGREVGFGISVATLDPELGRLWEPHAPGAEGRLRMVQEARKAGLKTTIMFAPLLPFLSDGRDSICALFERAADIGVDSIWVDALNRRPRVWPSVARLLSDHFPGLRRRYRGIMFDTDLRSAYLDNLRTEVRLAAEGAGLDDRLGVCF
jgi:DNA repair photolyase